MEESKQTNNEADDIIRRKIMESLRENPSLDSVKIDVAVQNGTVILKGGIDTATEKQLAEKIAGDTEGVITVENHLHIDVGIAHALSSLASHIQGDIINNEEDKDDNDKK